MNTMREETNYSDTPNADLLRKFREDLFGKINKPVAVFHTHMMLDVAASHEAGKRVERPTPYITLRFPDSKNSEMSKRATEKQIAQYAEAFAAYEQRIRDGDEIPYEGWKGRRKAARGRGRRQDAAPGLGLLEADIVRFPTSDDDDSREAVG